MYQVFSHTNFEPCIDEETAICVNSTDGLDVLDRLGRVMPLFSSEDETIFDMVILIAIGLVFKLIYIGGVAYKTRQASKFHSA